MHFSSVAFLLPHTTSPQFRYLRKGNPRKFQGNLGIGWTLEAEHKPCKRRLPPPWKTNMVLENSLCFKRIYIYIIIFKWLFFHCHASFSGVYRISKSPLSSNSPVFRQFLPRKSREFWRTPFCFVCRQFSTRQDIGGFPRMMTFGENNWATGSLNKSPQVG